MSLQELWFFLWVLLWAVYFALDGFDLGLGTLIPFISKTEKERRVIYRSIGPFWDGNEVWLVAAGGITFAAFPGTYASMFSSLYAVLMLVLFGLIFRGVSVEFRGSVENKTWGKVWDYCMMAGSFLPAFFFGVTFANLFKGIPIGEDGVFRGSMFSFFNIYALFGGLLFVLLFIFHGSIWLSIKSEKRLHARAKSLSKKLMYPLVAAIVLFVLLTEVYTDLLDNYLKNPLLLVIPLIILILPFYSRISIQKDRPWRAWFSSALLIIATTFFGYIGMYPNLVLSSIDPKYNRTLYNSSSSPLTLKIMLIVVAVFIPLVILYQIWTYSLFRGKVTEEELKEEGDIY